MEAKKSFTADPTLAYVLRAYFGASHEVPGGRFLGKVISKLDGAALLGSACDICLFSLVDIDASDLRTLVPSFTSGGSGGPQWAPLRWRVDSALDRPAVVYVQGAPAAVILDPRLAAVGALETAIITLPQPQETPLPSTPGELLSRLPLLVLPRYDDDFPVYLIESATGAASSRIEPVIG